jgi:tetratricopeptide (TPR) repeat protein
VRSFETSLAEATRTGDLISELFARVNRARALLAQGRMADVEAELANVSRLTAGRETAARRPVARAQMVEAEALSARGELPQAQQQIEAALQKLRAAASSRDALYLGSALLTAGRIAAARQHYPEAQDKAQQALDLFQQRARQPQQSADVGEALLLLAN